MKELSIEEKAELFDKAYKIAESIHRFSSNLAEIKRMEEIFPELKESEDERIRKHLIQHFRNKSKEDWNGVPVKSVLAWLEKQGQTFTKKDVDDAYLKGVCDTKHELEKQGEQKSVDKAEPKFKVGKWYQCTKDFFGKGVTFDKNTAYYCAEEGCLQDEYGCHIAIVKDLYDNFKLWDISDAKDGDVLAVTMYPEGTWIGIFKEQNGCTFSSHCFVNTEGTFKLGTHNHGNGRAIHPATKEQRDLLFQKMKEAGYEWDAEKKELKRIEQKSTWSEEDERNLQGIWDEILANKHDAKECEWKTYDKFLDWLKSIQERVQPKQEWSEEDEATFTVIGSLILDNFTAEYASKTLTWLHSLKPQNRWKPSDEQMAALSDINVTGCISYAGQGQELINLYNDLKKLK